MDSTTTNVFDESVNYYCSHLTNIAVWRGAKKLQLNYTHNWKKELSNMALVADNVQL